MPPANLYTIRGPIYVEPASLQPPLFGPPLMGPPVASPPVVGHPVISPSPFNPYAPNYPMQMLYDENQDEVSSQSQNRRMNTNVQSGIQQFGQGNMNLQGNIQQVNRRSSIAAQQVSNIE